MVKFTLSNPRTLTRLAGSALLMLVALAHPMASAGQFEGKLSPDSLVAGQDYGTVAVDENDAALIVVAAPKEDHPVSPLDAGAVYVHRFDGSQWVQEQRVISPNPGNFDAFGSAVAIAGNTLFVGELNDDAAGLNTGAVHLYNFNGSEWSYSSTLVSSTPSRDDAFGGKLALSGDILVVASSGDDEGFFSAGAAFVFRNIAGSWVQEAKLMASDTTQIAFFGTDVATDGDRIVVSALQATADGNVNAGAAYIFTYDGVGWTEEDRIIAPEPRGSTNYGSTVDIEGDRVLVGHNLGSPTSVSGNGAAHFYFHDEGGSGDWMFRQTLVPTGADSVGFMLFGSTVKFQGSTALVGAPNWASGSSNASGRVYGFEFDAADTLLLESTGYVSNDGTGGDEFGKSIAATGDAVFIGAPGHQVQTGSASGAVYAFGMPPVGTAVQDDKRGGANRQLLSGMFPNPADDYVTIALSPAEQPVQVMVFDMLGRKRADVSATDDHQIRTRRWPAGQYVVIARSGASVTRRLFTVLH